MESLALLAALIVSIASVGGPIALILAYMSSSYKKSHLSPKQAISRIYFAFTLLFAIPAILVGVRLLTLNLGTGGLLIGFLGVTTGSWAIFKLFRQQ